MICPFMPIPMPIPNFASCLNVTFVLCIKINLLPAVLNILVGIKLNKRLYYLSVILGLMSNQYHVESLWVWIFSRIQGQLLMLSGSEPGNCGASTWSLDSVKTTWLEIKTLIYCQHTQCHKSQCFSTALLNIHLCTVND